MKRIRVRIEEYEESDVIVEVATNTIRLDLPKEALERIREVARKTDNKSFLRRLRERLSDQIKSHKEEGSKPSYFIPWSDVLLLIDLEQLNE